MALESSILSGIRDIAAVYYAENPEYLDDVGILQGVLEGVRGQVIAIDLEATLVSNSINDQGYAARLGIKPWCGGFGVKASDLEYVKRPLAEDLVRILVENGNEVFLWTAARGGVPARAIESSGLEVPMDTPFICRDFYGNKVRHLLETGEIAFDTMNNKADVQTAVREGKLKVPSVLGMDFLIDDLFKRHALGALALGRKEDVDKLIPVVPFSLDKFSTKRCQPGELSLCGHLGERGLLEMARELAKRVRKKMEWESNYLRSQDA